MNTIFFKNSRIKLFLSDLLGKVGVLFCVHLHDVVDHVLYHLNVSHSPALSDRMAVIWRENLSLICGLLLVGG